MFFSGLSGSSLVLLMLLDLFCAIHIVLFRFFGSAIKLPKDVAEAFKHWGVAEIKVLAIWSGPDS